MINTAFVHGSAASISWADGRKSLTDLIFEGVSAALADAGKEMREVDSVVLASHDLIDGRSLSSMITAPAAGGYLRDETRVVDDGLVALSLGAARVAAGESTLTVVAAWGRASEADFLRTSRAAMDPFTTQPLGLSEFDISAFRLSAWLAAHGGGPAERAAASSRRAARRAANPRAGKIFGPGYALPFPLLPAEAPGWADVVAAAVIGADEAPVRIAGVGHGTDPSSAGERDLVGMPALRAAAAMAIAEAGTTMAAIEMFELDGMTLSDEILSMEALGLCAAGTGFSAYAGDDAVNPSGGGAGGWCFPAMGLVRFAECHRQLQGRAGPVQRRPWPRRALATGAGPVGGQTMTAAILEIG